VAKYELCGASASTGWTTTGASFSIKKESQTTNHEKHHEDDPTRLGPFRVQRRSPRLTVSGRTDTDLWGLMGVLPP
jgi:hypothetical protein